jgi:hypothetical protein
MKRKSTSTKGAAKRSRTDPRIPKVLDAIADAETLPANLRSLLKHALPVAFKTYKADRHPYEVEVVEQAKQALDAVENALKLEHGTAFAKQQEVISPAEKARRAGAKKEAEARSEEAKRRLDAGKVAKKAAEKNVEDAEAGLKTAKAEEKVADKALQKVVDKKASLTGSLAKEMPLLMGGTSSSADGRHALKKLLAIGKEFGLDSTLLLTLPITCKKVVAVRSEFENMIFHKLQALIEEQIAAISQEVDAAEPVKQGKVAATAAAQQALEQARAALKDAESELEDGHLASKEASKEVTKADHIMRGIWEDMRRACEAQDKLASELKSFKDDTWEAFNQLKDKEPEPEPVEEPMEELAPAAEQPATEDVTEAVPEVTG